MPHDGSSGQQYHTLGYVELATILQSGCVTLHDDHITIDTPQKALLSIALLSERLRDLCMNEQLNGALIRDTVKTLLSDARSSKEQIGQVVEFVTAS